VTRGKYVPEAGDIVWLQFDPQLGSEQAGKRPAVVLSSAIYNGKTNLMLCCPMTTRIKGYPFEVIIHGDLPNVALADQVKSLDWVARQARLKGRVAPGELSEIRAKAAALLGVP
jgi:mRNA interferase MazF